MALASGTRLGPYEISAQIGTGGMGEVYRARDTKLDRDVAIKVLPESLASDGERVARFEREARTLAALNHPNIAHIHGFEESNGLKALVMEFVEGATLADRIAEGPVPVDEALPIAKQIAEALEAAHELNIIHRDLKPANVKVRPDGAVKVLDFGLAKAMEPAGALSAGSLSQSPTITTPAMTQVGMILGTAAYMSPEQARGRPVDRRTDVWALGCVLYEMLAGVPAFSGEDVGEVLAAVIKTDVDWDRVAGVAPVRIETLLRRCLRKDQRRRLGDAGTVRIEIEDVLASPGETKATPSSRTVVSLWLALVAGLTLAVASAATTAWLRTPGGSKTPAKVARITLSLPPGTELTDGPSVVISPDGTRIAYVASRGGVPQLYLRALNEFDARPLADTQWAAAPSSRRMGCGWAFSPTAGQGFNHRGLWLTSRRHALWARVTCGPVTRSSIRARGTRGDCRLWRDQSPACHRNSVRAGGRSSLTFFRVVTRCSSPRPVATAPRTVQSIS